jgi:hypothetical protein
VACFRQEAGLWKWILLASLHFLKITNKNKIAPFILESALQIFCTGYCTIALSEADPLNTNMKSFNLGTPGGGPMSQVPESFLDKIIINE